MFLWSPEASSVPCCKSEFINRALLEMFSGFQERYDHEDELYRDEEDSSGLSDSDSELEFRLYSQLHYNAEFQENHEESSKVQPLVPQTQLQLETMPPAPPVDVIVIDSGPDSFTVSDSTEDDESVCANKVQSLKHCKRKSQPSRFRSPSPPQVQAGRSSPDDVVVLDSDLEQSSSESEPPFVEDLDSDTDSDSDSDGLENWMILGKGRQDEDQSIQLNLAQSSFVNTEYVNYRGQEQKWTVSEKDKQAQIYNKGHGPRHVPNRSTYRYYTEKSITCRNCNKTGHLSKNCPTLKKVPCCSLCGLRGHLLRTCPNRHCSNCSLPGHTSDDCLERAFWYKRCHRCGMTGHFIDACPQIWRQYHLTTTAGPIRKSADPKACQKRAYCYNCSRKGHFGHQCSQRRMYNWSYPSLPVITYYDTVNDIKCRDFRLKKKAREMQDAGLISPDGGVVTFTPQPPRKKQKVSHSPHPYSNNTNNHHTPKKRIAHTPKHNPQTNQQNTHWRVKQNSKKPGPHGKNTPQSKEFKSQKKEAKNKKRKKKKAAVIDEDADFPRGSKKSPHKAGFHSSPQKANVKPVKLFGVEKNHMKKKDKSKKKERIQRKRQQKAAKDSAAYPTDENLFQIKQRKVKRSK